MNLSTIPVVRLVIQQLLNYGIHHVVIAPGSRNAPITVGLTTHKGFTTYSIVDERSAGFLQSDFHNNFISQLLCCVLQGLHF